MRACCAKFLGYWTRVLNMEMLPPAAIWALPTRTGGEGRGTTRRRANGTTKAADMGEASGMDALGLLYENGRGVTAGLRHGA